MMENENNTFGNGMNNQNNGTSSFTAGTSSETAGGASASDNTASENSTYAYSYLNQEQKNPNNVWRADENTSSGSQNSQSAGYGYTGNQSYSSSQNYHTGNQNYGGSQNYNGNPNYAGNQTYSQSYSNGYQQNAAPNMDQKAAEKERKRIEKAQKKAQRKAMKANRPKRPAGFGNKMAKCAALALVFGLVAGTGFQGVGYLFDKANGTDTVAQSNDNKSSLTTTTSNSDSDKTASSATSTTALTDVSSIAENAMPSIVAITNTAETQVQDFFGQTQAYESQSAGSGIIVSEDDKNIYIATNNHVVEGAETLTVQFVDESTATATVKGTSESNDLAVVEVAKDDIEKDTLSTIKVATLDDSDDVKVGEAVIAIGNALGYGQSVTTGVISALDREVTVSDETTGESTTSSLLQTDAAINPGNSGGALLNTDGEVIGINSSKYSDTSVEGMGFSIPMTTAAKIIDELITREAVSENQTAYLGISGVDVTSDVAATYNMPAGVYVAKVASGSGAEKAGIAQGDIITAFDGQKVSSMEELQDLMKYYSAGTKVKVTISRAESGKYTKQELTVTLGSKQ